MTSPDRSAEIPQITLNDGLEVQALGFGTYKLNGSSGVQAMVDAIHNGYRLIDSAFNYENEGAVGQAVRRAGVAREDLRITSKLPGRRQRHAEALATIEESLWRAGLDYYDLYLIHWPNPKQGLYVEAWTAMIEARNRGLIRSIGVCNFLPEHLEKLKAETGVLPSVNQIELHPRFPQDEQLAYDRAQGIATQSWSPLGRGAEIRDTAEVRAVAQQTGRSPAQVILRWHVQLGAIPIPKASTPARQVENRSVFDFTLDAKQMATISGLARPDGRLKGQDPATWEEF